MVETPLGLYIHWPFCVAKCPYCDFNSHVRESVDVAAWRNGLLADMAHERARTGPRTLASIFFGGGTPSLMPPDLVADVIAAARRHWQAADDIEITLEANPNSVESARFALLAQAGVNRLSLGIQAFDDATLAFLGRAHSADEGLAAIAIAQAHFARVSFDLIYALPGQEVRQWSAILDRALALGTGHLSLYQLTIEPGTRFESDVRRGAFVPLDDDAAADLFHLTQERTEAAGMPAYETSNHAAPGQQSRHNLGYWRSHDHVGIGPGAHGRRCAAATVRHRKPENWLKAIAATGHGIAQEEAIAPDVRATEALLMGLRLVEGVDLQDIADRTGVWQDRLLHADAARRLAGLGLLWREETRIGVTRSGRPLLDSILTEIVAVEPEILPRQAGGHAGG